MKIAVDAHGVYIGSNDFAADVRPKTVREDDEKSFAALVSHLKFVKDHHKKITHVALATDSPLGEFGEHIASHFVNAEIRHFAYGELEEAKAWAVSGESD